MEHQQAVGYSDLKYAINQIKDPRLFELIDKDILSCRDGEATKHISLEAIVEALSKRRAKLVEKLNDERKRYGSIWSKTLGIFEIQAQTDNEKRPTLENISESISNIGHKLAEAIFMENEARYEMMNPVGNGKSKATGRDGSILDAIFIISSANLGGNGYISSPHLVSKWHGEADCKHFSIDSRYFIIKA